MQADERAFLEFHAWQVYYRTHLGMVLLPTGTRLPGACQWSSGSPPGRDSDPGHCWR